MLKEFKTIAEQINILKARGMHVDESASTVLLRENYYSIINGYKDPFLDKEAMQSSADDVYLEGVRFEWLYSLFRFDGAAPNHLQLSYPGRGGAQNRHGILLLREASELFGLP